MTMTSTIRARVWAVRREWRRVAARPVRDTVRDVRQRWWPTTVEWAATVGSIEARRVHTPLGAARIEADLTQRLRLHRGDRLDVVWETSGTRQRHGWEPGEPLPPRTTSIHCTARKW